ncbi:MAG: type IIA DNA topoisomerase subunit B [Paludibacteraceae bacterium]|nr:type IIA DNA topoisomerase subunit B [Paludibacteraceae bacterium]
MSELELNDTTVNDNLVGEYTDENIVTLEGLEAVRKRPGMYIGNTHGGSDQGGGLYLLLKETIDNSVDEFRIHAGNLIEVKIEDGLVSVRDHGRGIPQGNLATTLSTLHTSGKFDSESYKKSVGLNGVGSKAVNALSTYFRAVSYRDGWAKEVVFECGKLKEDRELVPSTEQGTLIEFRPDTSIFENINFRDEYVEQMLANYSYLNVGLSLTYKGKKYHSRNGLVDLLNANLSEDEMLYPLVHLQNGDIEIAFTHTNQSRDDYYSFVNGQYTPQGGTHQAAFKEWIARTIKEFYNKNQDPNDIRNGLVAAININIQEPEFEAQTKVKLGSRTINPMDKDAISVNKFVGDFVKNTVDDYLHKNPNTASVLLTKIQESERERKEIATITKKDRDAKKRISLRNSKLRDCHIHLNDTKVGKEDRRDESCIFITEGNSASGSITKIRNVETQAVFSLRGKPLNTFTATAQDARKNQEFALLNAALNIDEGLDGLRYNKVIIATDADVDGMHIRLLLMTFFLKYYPDLVKKGHVYVLQTPLFRVRNKKETRYCYSEEERQEAVEALGPKPEITRFKGLGEISADEFAVFIGKDMRLDQMHLRKEDGSTHDMLSFYMGKNTDRRQRFIINNLVVDEEML